MVSVEPDQDRFQGPKGGSSPRGDRKTSLDDATWLDIEQRTGVPLVAGISEPSLEDELRFYRSRLRQVAQSPHSKKRERLQRIVRAAEALRGIGDPRLKARAMARTRLLSRLCIKNQDEIWDGVGDGLDAQEVFEALTSELEEEVYRKAIVSLAHSDDWDAVQASAATIQDAAQRALASLDEPVLRQVFFADSLGNQRDRALNDLIYAGMQLYAKCTERPIATSVAKDGDYEGVACGPLIRFLEAFGEHVLARECDVASSPTYLEQVQRHREIFRSKDALRSRVRRLLSIPEMAA